MLTATTNERCQIQSGGVYFLVSHILGGRIGGAVGVLYSFGQVGMKLRRRCAGGRREMQAVGVSLVAVGFGESMAHMLGTGEGLVVRVFAAGVILALLAINVAGVKWVIKLQLFLLAFLLTAVADLVLGSLFTSHPGSHTPSLVLRLLSP